MRPLPIPLLGSDAEAPPSLFLSRYQQPASSLYVNLMSCHGQDGVQKPRLPYEVSCTPRLWIKFFLLPPDAAE